MSYMQFPSYFNIIPIEGKKPLIDWKGFTTKPQTTEEKNEFRKFSNLGIITGAVSRIFVLDDDGGLDVAKFPMPKTWTAKTPRGGTHYYFQYVDSLKTKTTTKVGLMEKVDVRGDGGLVAFYGFTKPYYITPLAPPPQWLIDLLPTKDGIATETIGLNSGLIDRLNSIQPGHSQLGRTPVFQSIVNILKKQGLDAGLIFGFLKPWADKYEYKKLEALVVDQFRRYPPLEADNGEDLKTSDLLKTKEKTSWLVDPQLISRHSTTFIAGLPESKKSWVLMDLALALATGTQWLGKFDTKQCKVMYLDQERPKVSTIERFNKLITGRGLKSKDIDESLLIKPQSRVRVDLPISFNAFERKLEVFKPDVILVDSFKKFHTKNELSSQDIQFVLAKINEIKDKYDCSFVFIHHEPKKVQSDRRENFEVKFTDAAGTVDLSADAEHFFNIVCINDDSTIYHTKNNLGHKIAPTLIRVEDLDENRIKVQGY